MSGKVIDFGGQRDLRRAKLDRQAPRSLAAERANVHQQIIRIALLLRELEALAHAGQALPPGVLAEARASIESTRKTLLSWPESLPRGRAAARGGDGAQPNVDRDLLEKMYRDLGLLP